VSLFQGADPSGEDAAADRELVAAASHWSALEAIARDDSGSLLSALEGYDTDDLRFMVLQRVLTASRPDLTSVAQQSRNSPPPEPSGP
jgi:hypothetical protein